MPTIASDPPRFAVDVWSDVMCPWCYLGDALLAKALEQFPHAADVVVRYHSFLLMPELSPERAINMTEALVRDRGYPRAQLAASHAQLTLRGKEVGLDYQFEKVLGVNTRAAHRLSHFGREHGAQRALMRRLFRAVFTDGLHVGDHEVLADLAAEVGLDRAAALEALASGAFEADVMADLKQARELGISGVPFFVFDERYAVSGAQPVDALLKALGTAWKAKTP